MGSKHSLILTFTVILASLSTVAEAAHVRASSGAVTVVTIYANEWGSPFVRVSPVVNSACNGGNGLYLYNVEISNPSAQLRANKMAMLLSAKMSGRRIILDYFYDAAQFPNWDACYIHGFELID